MRKFIIQAILLLIVAAAALLIFKSGMEVNLPFLPERTVAKIVQINDAKITVEIADTQDKRKKGLSGRQSIASDGGMLFVFEKRGKYPFWMKGLTFPLDLIWIKDDKVSEILENVPPPAGGQSDELLPIYQSKEDIDKMLEVSAGTVRKFNIKPGDVIKII